MKSGEMAIGESGQNGPATVATFMTCAVVITATPAVFERAAGSAIALNPSTEAWTVARRRKEVR